MKYRVMDDEFPAGVLAQACAEWPHELHPAWVSYDTPEQRKRTLGCRRWASGRVVSDWPYIPPACRELLGMMLQLDVAGLLNLPDTPIPDALLWGAGLHEMRRGDRLGIHLDADRHPLLGLERRANAILYLGPTWHREYGGELDLHDGDDSGPAERLASVPPRPGRLVLFETDDRSWHGSPVPLTCPGDESRKSLAVYWWAQHRGEAKRPRARFAEVAP